MERVEISRDSAEYAEVIAEVFVETVEKSASTARLHGDRSDDITPALAECLRYIYLHGASAVREIAWGLQISVSAASQLVDRLVRKDLATRRESEADRRLAMVDPTDAGREIVERMRRLTSDWFASVVEAMPKHKRQAFMEGIEGFLSVALANEDNIDWACARCGENASFCVVRKIKQERKNGCG